MLFAYKLKDPLTSTFIGNKIIARNGSLITTDLQVTADLSHYGLLEPAKDNVVDVASLVSPMVPECTVRLNESGKLEFSPFLPAVDDEVPFMQIDDYYSCISAYSELMKLLKPA